jgi:hypothetical protein
MVSFEKQKRSSNGRVILTDFDDVRDAGAPPLRGLLGVRMEASAPADRRAVRRTVGTLGASRRRVPDTEGAPAGLVPSRRSGAKRERIVPPIVPGIVSGFPPTLRERVPGITPAEETLCMLIKMNLSNREIADKMSISIGSLHTTRYRLKQKMPPEAAKGMDEWVRAIE